MDIHSANSPPPDPELVAGHASQDNKTVGQVRAPKRPSAPSMPPGSSGTRKKNANLKRKNHPQPDLYRLFSPQGQQWDKFLAIKFRGDDMNDLEFEKHIVKVTGDKEITFHTDRDNNKIIKTKDSLTSEKFKRNAAARGPPSRDNPSQDAELKKGNCPV